MNLPRLICFSGLVSILSWHNATFAQSVSPIRKLPDQKIEPVAEDYFDDAMGGVIVKWELARFPLKVHIASSAECTGIKGYKPEFEAVLRSAFEEWQLRSGNAVSFAFVQDADDSDIECVWVNELQDRAGETQPAESSNHGLHHAKIVMTVPNGFSNGLTMESTLKGVALHEVGHSVGLSHHSKNPDDAMFGSIDRLWKPALSLRDLATVKRLYSPLVPVCFRCHTDKTDKESLNNEGLLLASEKRYAEAAEKFRAVLILEPGCEPAKLNLANCLHFLAYVAMANHEYGQAETNVRQALSVLDGLTGDNNMRAKLMHLLTDAVEARKKEATFP